MINIISTFYISKYNSQLDTLRTQELENCLINNVNSEIIEKIHLFVDDNDAYERIIQITNNSEKIVIIEIGKKPKYTDFFNYIFQNLENKICMITNADIYIYYCQLNLIEVLKTNALVYSLTRYEYDLTCPLIETYQGSHDCYIFNSSFLKKTIINEDTNFYQNFPGIETHIIKAFCDNGFKPLNPCRQIKIVHYHKTQLRNHGEWIGLHRVGDVDFFNKSCWCVPPITINFN
jgi:hypothetical protein